jgi:hypothetical protein
MHSTLLLVVLRGGRYARVPGEELFTCNPLYGHGSLLNCVTSAVFPGVPSATVTILAVF